MVATLIAEASFMKKKRDAEYQAESVRMEKKLPKARAKVYDGMEGIYPRIDKDTEVFLPKKFDDNEVTLPNVPKGVAIEKIK